MKNLRYAPGRRVAAAVVGITALAALAPAGAASPTLLVLNKGNLTMVTVDPATLKVTGSYPSGPNPHEVVASADGATAYISNYGAASSITVIDLAARNRRAPSTSGH